MTEPEHRSRRQSSPLPPEDLPHAIQLGQTIKPVDIRDLNELIRMRYALDCEIWRLKDCAPRDRKALDGPISKMRR